MKISKIARWIFIGWVFSGAASCSQEEPEIVLKEASRLEILEQYWLELRELQESQPSQVFTPPVHTTYPAYSALNLVAAYWVLGFTEYADAAERQLLHAHSMENADHLFTAPHSTRLTRDELARHLFSLIISARFLEDDKYLKWADDVVQSMIVNLQRGNYITEKGNRFTIFYSTYEIVPPYAPSSNLLISTNQNAAMGMAFTLLTNTAGSRYYQDELIAEIAREEIEASMDPLLPTGELPLGDPVRNCYDTSYGAYTAFCWAVANGYENNPVWRDRLALVAKWLDSVGNVECRCYPQEVTNELLVEGAFTRALIANSAGEDAEKWLVQGYDLISNKDIRQLEMTKVGRETPITFYELAGFKQESYMKPRTP